MIGAILIKRKVCKEIQRLYGGRMAGKVCYNCDKVLTDFVSEKEGDMNVGDQR